MVDYVKTVWVDVPQGEEAPPGTPARSAANLNKMEDGIYDGFTTLKRVTTFGNTGYSFGNDTIIGNDAVNLSDSGTATAADSFSVNFGCNAIGVRSFACNYNTEAGQYSFSCGYYSTSDNYSFASGRFCVADGYYSHAEGYETVAGDNSSHAEGYRSSATGNSSHAEGSNNIASGTASHAEGDNNISAGDYSHTEGNYNVTNAYSGHTQGEGNTNDNYYSFVGGSYSAQVAGAMMTVGIGTWNDRKNGFLVLNTGEVQVPENTIALAVNARSVATKEMLDTKLTSTITGEPAGSSVVQNIVFISQADYDAAALAGTLVGTTHYIITA